MPPKPRKISLIYFVIITLLLVGLVPLVLTGWFLSRKSGDELRAVENRYQTQLVQEKARQIEMYGQRYSDLVLSFANAFELSDNLSILSSPQTEKKLGETLKENPGLLALYVKPVQGESLSVFRAEAINKAEIESLSTDTLGRLGNKKVLFSQPQKLNSSGEIVLAVASSVVTEKNVTAGVVAVISMHEISRIMSEIKPMSELELWRAGLPIIFVIDKNGKAVFHPDAAVVAGQRPLTDLKIVQEWQATNNQIQSALVPFTAEFDGEKHEMIGAYSTANFSQDLSFGVIAMQDENKALASVGEMRRQTWMISLAFALFALISAAFLLNN